MVLQPFSCSNIRTEFLQPKSLANSFVRVYILFRPSAQPIASCLNKPSRACAHGRKHLCTLTSHFQYHTLCILHIFAEMHPLRSISLWWNRKEVALQEFLPRDVKGIYRKTKMCKYQYLRCNCVADNEPFIASQMLILMTFTLQTWKDGKQVSPPPFRGD